MRKIIASLDIGTNTIKLIVGEMIKEKLNVLTLAESPSKGVKLLISIYLFQLLKIL